MSRPILNANLLGAIVKVNARGPVRLKALQVHNPSNAAAYVQFFDIAAPVDKTLGTDAPDWAVGLNTLLSDSFSIPSELTFGKGLCVAATTTPTGMTAPNTGLVVNFAIDDG